MKTSYWKKIMTRVRSKPTSFPDAEVENLSSSSTLYADDSTWTYWQHELHHDSSNACFLLPLAFEASDVLDTRLLFSS